LLAFLLLLWPEHEMAQDDPISSLFLPETLLTVHAGVIRDQMAADLRAGNPTRYTDQWLRTLHDRLALEIRTSREEGRSYPSLGFDPDFLLYNAGSYCRFLYDEMSIPRLSKLAFYFYFRAWRNQPGPMLRNVARQLAIFYAPRCPAFSPRHVVDLDKSWRASVEVYTNPAHKAEVDQLPPARRYLADCLRLGQTRVVVHQPPLLMTADAIAGACHLYLLGIMAAGVAIAAGVKGGQTKRDLLTAGSLVLFFAAFNFGACLTVAIVHSFDVDRYSLNQFVLALLFVCAAFAWCAEALLALWQLVPEGQKDQG